MRAIRFSIAALMGTVLILALGLAALRDASETSAGWTFLATCAGLALATVGAVCRGAGERAWWLGFALFGWGYLAVAFWSSRELPTTDLLATIFIQVEATIRRTGGMFPFPDPSVQEIIRTQCAMVAAIFGGVLARALFRGRSGDPENQAGSMRVGEQARRNWWLRPALIGLVGSAPIILLAATLSRSESGIGVGAIFLLTCGLLGLAVLGAAIEMGRRRQIWLGAAIFGAGYMTMAFGPKLVPVMRHRPEEPVVWPRLPTNHLLSAVRPWFAPIATGFPNSSSLDARTNARILEALERPIPMRFPKGTPLEDVVKYIKIATQLDGWQGIPIYIDPIGLQEAEKSLSSTITPDLEGVALKTTLRLSLKQPGLTYTVKDGFMIITSDETEDVFPVYEDAYLIVGHCFLALFAAVCGGVLAPLVCGMYGGTEKTNARI